MIMMSSGKNKWYCLMVMYNVGTILLGMNMSHPVQKKI